MVAGAVLPFDKPYGWSSFDAIRYVQRIIRKKADGEKFKIGHAGTLDPLATGLLLICIGKATKQAESLQAEQKEYVADVCFGATTASYDLETEPIAVPNAPAVAREQLENQLQKMLGEQQQMPPNFSAKQIDGQRAYTLARKGVDVNVKPSFINIYDLQLLSFEYPYARILVRCSKGTYIRSLANDLGISLKSSAYLCGLRRTASGNFTINQSVNIEQLDIFLQ
ncbi:MAG: tRNA pseudouridine(55) synthase TruB [Prevotellaceae bacterium]|jgi:tRNA pseudouridine55 synthase|nr:tRNA pseudouridine(55) synthase TruB [Prevotellaceae bacterium]